MLIQISELVNGFSPKKQEIKWYSKEKHNLKMSLSVVHFCPLVTFLILPKDFMKILPFLVFPLFA